MMPILPIYSLTFGQMGIHGVPPPHCFVPTAYSAVLRSLEHCAKSPLGSRFSVLDKRNHITINFISTIEALLCFV